MGKCKKQYIPEDVCYIKFTDDFDFSTLQEDIGVTCRGEMVIIDYDDRNGQIVGIELVGNGKPCQRGLDDEKDKD